MATLQHWFDHGKHQPLDWEDPDIRRVWRGMSRDGKAGVWVCEAEGCAATGKLASHGGPMLEVGDVTVVCAFHAILVNRIIVAQPYEKGEDRVTCRHCGEPFYRMAEDKRHFCYVCRWDPDATVNL